MESAAVFVNKVSKSFGGEEVICGVHMQVERGSIYGLLGPSGCGYVLMLAADMCGAY